MAASNINKDCNTLTQIVKASDTIRYKHRMIKHGEEISEQTMKDAFKPIVKPLENLVTTFNQMKQEIKDALADIRMKSEPDQSFATAMNYDEEGTLFDNNDAIKRFEHDEITSESSSLKQDDNLTLYMKMLMSKQSNSKLNVRFGVRKTIKGTFWSSGRKFDRFSTFFF
ncbi:hypothetical protein PV326_011946, partial [Microctonus aethiopoides]